MILQKCSLWKVAEVFFREPTRVHYIKEISKKINLAHTSVKKHVRELIGEGLVEQTEGDIYTGYRAKRDSPHFIFAKKISNQILLQESGLLDVLKENYPEAIIIFGSYDKGEDLETSDIDIYADIKRYKTDLEKFESHLKRKIQIIFKGEASKSLMGSINQGTLLYGDR